jgi:hypothetical protein
MSVQNLTMWQRQRCSEFLDWLLDVLARSVTATKSGRKVDLSLTNKRIAAKCRQIFDLYSKTGVSGFADAAEVCHRAWLQWRVEVGIHPMRRMKWRSGRLKGVGKPFIPAKEEPSDKKRKSDWMGSRFWLACLLAGKLGKVSSYGFVMSELRRRNAFMTADAIKVRVCEFRKSQSASQLSYIARDLFDAFKGAQFRARHPRKLAQLRAVGLHLTMASDRELDLVQKLS